MADATVVPAHDQSVAHRYVMHYPPHPPRAEDPHYAAFEAWKKANKDGPKWKCAVGLAKGTFDECTLDKPLEIHHAHIEFALQQGVDAEALERAFPGITDPAQIPTWIESEANFEVLCVFHHRGHGGAHVASASDFEAEKFVLGLIT